NPAICTFPLNPSSGLYDVGAGSGSFSVQTQAGCTWSALNTDGWIQITVGATGVGAGTVSFNLAPTNRRSRTSTFSVQGQSFTISECGYVISPTSAAFSYRGGSDSVTVSAAAGCSWSAASNASWIHITSGASGSGNGTVNYNVDGFCIIGPA